MNAHSSRSHAIMIIKIEKHIRISEDRKQDLFSLEKEKIMKERLMTKSMLFLVDLAGSERVKKTHSEGMRLEEAKKINYSLLVLGNCIQSLIDPKSNHVNYRDSKLTRLLQESLGGNTKTSLIVTISPSAYNLDETISSMMFGQRAMKVKNKPVINKTVDYQTLSYKLQEDLDKINDDYAKLKIQYDLLVQQKTCDCKSIMRQSIKNEIKLFEVSMTDKNDKSDKSDLEKKGSAEVDSNIRDSILEEIKEKCADEIRKLENFYEELIKDKDLENEKVNLL